MKTLKLLSLSASMVVYVSLMPLGMAEDFDLNTVVNQPSSEENKPDNQLHSSAGIDRFERLHKKSGAQLRKEERESRYRVKRPHFQESMRGINKANNNADKLKTKNVLKEEEVSVSEQKIEEESASE